MHVFPEPIHASPPMNHRFDVLAGDKLQLLFKYKCLAMLIQMLYCPLFKFHNYDVDGMFGYGGYLWYLIKLFKRLG